MSLNDPQHHQQLEQQLDQARLFFSPSGATSRSAVGQLYAAPEPTLPKIEENKNGVFSVVHLKKKVAASIQDDLDRASECMINLAYLGTQHCQRLANKKNDPDLLFDTKSWKDVLTHYPMLGPFQFERSKFNQKIRGLDFSSEVLTRILGAAVGGPVVEAFQKFLGGFGTQIKAGVDRSSKPFHFVANTVFIDAKQSGNTWMVEPKLRMYFCDFTSRQSKVYTSCASATMTEVDLDYIAVEAVWNYALYKRDRAVAEKFDKLVGNTAMSQLDESENFFNFAV